ncbi:MAG: hypothetical protein LBF80_01160 [Spirochaetaceae bacterium]|jgi:flagellar motor component MotA|nr:hypothetical protein [Spirochaetaceae bacterium]
MKKLIAGIVIVVLAFVISRISFSYLLINIIDLWAFVSTPLGATIYTFVLYGFKESINSFKIPLKNDASNAELQSSLKFFNSLGKAYLYFSGLVTSICIVDMFIKLNEKITVGPRLAAAIISVLYAVLMHLLVIIPYKGIINKSGKTTMGGRLLTTSKLVNTVE